MAIKTPIYFDYLATCPTDPRVAEEMQPYWSEMYGNPASRSHKFGWDAEAAIEKAREQIASVIGADAREIIFTSGATEADNLAITGLARFEKEKGNHIITVNTEHKAVLDTCRHLEEEGFEITYLTVQQSGLIDMEELKKAMTDKTILVSVMAANNEIGVLQDVQKVGKICKEANVRFHTDCAQAFGKIPLDVNEMNIDLMSISGHKIYGPKGIGALYVRRKPRIRLKALIHGGGHERGMRSGTLPVPLIVGLGKAAEICREEMAKESERVKGLRDLFITETEKRLPDVFLNGDRENRLPGAINISYAYVEGESLMMAISDLALSSGSACTSASLEPSYVLRALGMNDELAHSSLRLCIGRFTTEEEVRHAANKIADQVERLREMSPLWEMVQEGVDLDSVEWTEH